MTSPLTSGHRIFRLAYGRPHRSMATVVAVLLLAVLASGVLTLLPAAGASPVPTHPTSSALRTAVTLPTSLTLGSNPIVLNSSFWGTTVSSRAPIFANESSIVLSTPARTVVWPGANSGDQYDPFTNLTWADNNTSAPTPTTEVDFVRWCRSVNCSAIFELPGEIDNATIAAEIVNYTEHTLGFRPSAYEIGNEPGFWVHWGQPWGLWGTDTGSPSAPQYAWEVNNYTKAIRAVDPNASIIGIPGIGRTLPHLSTWVSDVIKVDGPNISAIALHSYPDLSPLDHNITQFYATLSSANPQSVPVRVPPLRADIAQARLQYGVTNPIAIDFTEIGSAISGRPDATHFGVYFPGAMYMAAEITQAIDANISNVDAYATVLGTSNSWVNVSGQVRPLYTLQSQILSRLGDQAYPVNFSGTATGLYGIATVDPSAGGRADLMVVNTNVFSAASFAPVLPGNVGSHPWVVWSWNNSTPNAQPVAQLVTGGVTSYTLPANSLVLFESQPYNVVPVRFVESGLPAGTRWFLGVGDTTDTSVATNFTEFLLSGNYSLTPGPVIGYPRDTQHERWLPTPPEDVVVGSSPLNVAVPYVLQFTIGLAASPPSSGTISPNVRWWDAGAPLTLTATADNGWVFRSWVGGGSGSYSGPGPVATIVPTGGVNETAVFAPGYLVNFTETGLPDGLNWSVSTAGQNFTGNAASIYAMAGNGTHGFHVAPVGSFYPRPASGAYYINGSSPPPIQVNFTQLRAAMPVNFTETGLPLGTNWSVGIRGTNSSSTSSEITVFETNGSYSYNVVPVPGFVARPPQGGFVVAGVPVNVSIAFVANSTGPTTYLVTFMEQGLPGGDSWSVAVAGGNLSSITPSISYYATNGTHGFRVAPVHDFYPRPASGAFRVNGSSPPTILISFFELRAAYAVNFSETGLTAGTNWSVEIRGVSYASTTTEITTYEANGSYTYNVSAVPDFVAHPPHGGFVVAGAALDIAISFIRNRTGPSEYLVQFNETGLPSGTDWSISIRGADYPSTTVGITTYETNGTYSYNVSAVPGYVAHPPHGGFTVAGANLSLIVVFNQSGVAPPLYVIEFSENGLPAGTEWSVTVRNVTVRGTASDLAVDEPNGTYSYRVGSPRGFSARPPLGGFVVDGPLAAAITITFWRNHTAQPEFPVVWAEAGLANNSTWSVTVRHLTYGTTASFLVVGERNGTYSYNITRLVGYIASPAHGTLIVEGASPPTIAVSFTRLFHVTFYEVGLPSGTQWGVRCAGLTVAGNSSTLGLDLIAGGWNFTAWYRTPGGHLSLHGYYTPQPAVGNASITDSPILRTIWFEFVPTYVVPSPEILSDIVALDRAIAVAAAIVAATVLTFVLLARRGDDEVTFPDVPKAAMMEPPARSEGSSTGPVLPDDPEEDARRRT